MNFVKNHKGKFFVAFCIIIVLVIAFFCGENNPERSVIDNDNRLIQEISNGASKSIQESNEQQSDNHSEEGGTETEQPIKAKEEHIISASDAPADSDKPEETEAIEHQLTCTLSVRCDHALGKINEKAEVIPQNGVILEEQTVVFYEGETVFHVLVRELKKNNIHLEFVNVPVYNSAYVEGIANLYELDCGELSGWMYKVNDWFPNYGCSRYQLKAGDRVKWVYTCDLGKDVGGHYSARNGNSNE